MSNTIQPVNFKKFKKQGFDFSKIKVELLRHYVVYTIRFRVILNFIGVKCTLYKLSTANCVHHPQHNYIPTLFIFWLREYKPKKLLALNGSAGFAPLINR